MVNLWWSQPSPLRLDENRLTAASPASSPEATPKQVSGHSDGFASCQPDVQPELRMAEAIDSPGQGIWSLRLLCQPKLAQPEVWLSRIVRRCNVGSGTRSRTLFAVANGGVCLRDAPKWAQVYHHPRFQVTPTCRVRATRRELRREPFLEANFKRTLRSGPTRGS